MRIRYVTAAVSVVVLDQATKFLVVRALAVGESRPLIEGFLHLTHVRNPGAAFGLLRGMPGLLALAAVVGIVVFGLVMVKDPPPVLGYGAALVSGGAMGNLLDRVAREWPFRGEVVDFVDLRFWPAFNVADAAITAGALTIIVAGFFDRDEAEDADTGADGIGSDRDRSGG